jgi:hypothetical protein
MLYYVEELLLFIYWWEIVMQRYLTILRRLITLTVIVLFALAIAILVLFLQAGRVKASHVLRFVATSSLVTSPTTLPSSASTSQSAGGIDPAIIAALIGVVGATVAALIAGGFAVYQVRRNAQLEQERLRMQSDFEEQRKAWEREQQRKEKEAEEIRVAQSIATHVKDYRNRLPTDLEMSLLQIPNMSRPLRITDVYVPIQLYQETQLTCKLDSALLEAEAERDPDAILKASYSYLENRATVSINPDEAIRNYKHCVIVGDPGAGKTTLLKSLALMSVDNQLADLPTLPIYVDLYTFAHSEYTDLLEFASWVWESRYDFPKVEARQGMEEHLKAGKALLLLDGLDDAVIGETFVVANAIKQLAARYQHTPIVVTAVWVTTLVTAAVSLHRSAKARHPRLGEHDALGPFVSDARHGPDPS